MFRRILVAVDKTPVSRAAYEQAIALAKLTNAKLMIMHSLFEHEAGSPEIPVTSTLPYTTELNNVLHENYHQQWQAFEKDYTSYLNWMTENAKSGGIDAEFSMTQGDPGPSICEIAQAWNADLLIIGSHGKTGVSELLLRSVSNVLTHHAPCNVLIVHQNLSPQFSSPSSDKLITCKTL